nr:MAG TPA: hypothetical protein [Bacteriophage sp.]
MRTISGKHSPGSLHRRTRRPGDVYEGSSLHWHKRHHAIHDSAVKLILGFPILLFKAAHINLDFHISINDREPFEVVCFARHNPPTFREPQSVESLYKDRPRS